MSVGVGVDIKRKGTIGVVVDVPVVGEVFLVALWDTRIDMLDQMRRAMVGVIAASVTSVASWQVKVLSVISFLRFARSSSNAPLPYQQPQTDSST